MPLPHTFICRTNPITRGLWIPFSFLDAIYQPLIRSEHRPLVVPPPFPSPLSQVMLRVGDLPRSTEWYERVLGMQLVRQRDNPEYK